METPCKIAPTYPTTAELLDALAVLVDSLKWEERRSGTTYAGYETARAILQKTGRLA